MSKKIKVLSIDGGGIRGILAGEILATLEKKLQQKSNNPDARLSDYFDLLVGTSTGGILTCLYLCPDGTNKNRSRFSARQAVDLYIQNGNNIFKTSFRQKIVSIDGISEEKYPAKELELLLQKEFNNVKLSQLLKPCLITAYDIFNRNVHLFAQHDAVKDSSYDYYLRDVARATSAAPTYFETALTKSMTGVSYPLVDGGLFANNPAMCAYAEAIQLFSSIKKRKVTTSDLFLLSIGTGSKKKQYEYDVVKDWGVLRWMEPILDIIAVGTSDATDFQLKQLFNSANVSDNYLRINPETGRASTEMDDASVENIQALKESGIHSSKKNDMELERIAELLLFS